MQFIGKDVLLNATPTVSNSLVALEVGSQFDFRLMVASGQYTKSDKSFKALQRFPRT